MTTNDARHIEMQNNMVTAVEAIDEIIGELQTPKTDLEMIVDEHLQSINRQLTIIAAALKLRLPENG